MPKKSSSADWLGAGRGKSPKEQGEDGAVGFATKLSPELLFQLRELSARLSLERGSRVKIRTLVEEALSDLIAKHRGK